MIVCFSVSSNAQRQTKLYIDDGSGHFYSLTAPSGGTGGTYTLPSSGLTFPAANAAGVLTNTGNGSLSWSPASGFAPAYVNAYLPYLFAPYVAPVGYNIATFETTQNVGFAINGSGAAVANVAGIYTADFSVDVSTAASFALYQNGVEVTASQVDCAANATTHGSAILSLNAGDVINIINTGGATVTFSPSHTGSNLATLTLVRIQ
jgi:hypothetical protein